MINRSEVIKAVAAMCDGVSQQKVKDVLTNLEDYIIEKMSEGETVRALTGVSFVPTYHEEYTRSSKVVSSGEYTIPAGYTCRVSLTKKFKERVNADA